MIQLEQTNPNPERQRWKNNGMQKAARIPFTGSISMIRSCLRIIFTHAERNHRLETLHPQADPLIQRGRGGWSSTAILWVRA